MTAQERSIRKTKQHEIDWKNQRFVCADKARGGLLLYLNQHS